MPRQRNLFDPTCSKPYKLSRTKIEQFLKCPRCFYLDRRRGIPQPSGPPFTLNSAVDRLLKREFDQYRTQGKPHPLMEQYGIRAKPFPHHQLEAWRNNFTGVQHLHSATNFLLYGAIDDLWMGDEGCFHVVDYKATSTHKVISLEDEWKSAYKRQMEFYQWLLRRAGFQVSNVGYFVYANGLQCGESFNAALPFSLQILSYDGSDAWVEQAVLNARTCLVSDRPPSSSEKCEWCTYRRDARIAEDGLAL